MNGIRNRIRNWGKPKPADEPTKTCPHCGHSGSRGWYCSRCGAGL